MLQTHAYSFKIKQQIACYYKFEKTQKKKDLSESINSLVVDTNISLYYFISMSIKYVAARSLCTRFVYNLLRSTRSCKNFRKSIETSSLSL